MARIFITGDCHASYKKFGFKSFPDGRDLTKDDFVIICGDFGLWDESLEQQYWMTWLEERPFTTLWIDGNHENFDMLNRFPIENWHGGKVHFIRPSVIHLMRGQLYTISEKRFFTFGGASSRDIKDGILERDDPMLKEKVRELNGLGASYRINHVSWWKEEMPDSSDLDEGIRTLENAGWKTDYILTHCCATSLQNALTHGKYPSNRLTDYFDKIRGQCQFQHWFFGHYHTDADWSERETCLYHQIVELTRDGYKKCLAARKGRHKFWATDFFI